MKAHLPITIATMFLAGPAAAQSTDQTTAIVLRARTQLLEAQQAAMERCDSTRIVVSLPAYDFKAKVERTRNTTVTIDWKGGCVDGKRDGEGTLTWVEDQEDIGVGRVLTDWRAEGRFVKGQRLGLWCMTTSFQIYHGGERPPGSSTPSNFCAVFASHAKPLTAGFRKQADGSWLEAVGNSVTKLPAGALEAHGVRVIADAAAGRTDLKIELVAQNEALDGLLPGAKIVLALAAANPSLKGKRVAIVLSSATLDEMERFKRARDPLIAASSGLTGESGEKRQKFIAASTPGRLLLNVAKTLRKHGVSAEPADDLTGLQQGRLDYAVVLDWTFKARFDLLGNFDSFPAYPAGGPFACETLRGFLVSPELKAVAQIHSQEACGYRPSARHGDLGYMTLLAGFFELRWGKSADDTGAAMLGLEHLVKN